MKKILLAMTAILMMLSSFELSAQKNKWGTTADSTVCKNNLSFYLDYVNQKQWLSALPSWRKAYKACPPTASQNLYIHGARIIREAIKVEKDKTHKAALIDTLMDIYKIRINTYTAPKHSVKARNSYALDYSFYFRNDYEGIYAVTNETIEANQENTNPNLFVGNLNAAVELYKAEKLGAEEVINVYERNTALIEKAPAKDEIEKAGLDEKKSALENLFISSKVASCENLIALFTPRYEATPDDYDLMNNIVRMMNTAENCADNDLYLNAVTAMYRISPTYKSAYGLYRLNYARNNIDDAVKYLKEAIASEESTAEEDSDYYYELALCLFRNGKNADAYAAAQKSVELNDANKGRAYFIMGQIWGSTVCGGNDIERRAPMWVAVDYLQKAKAADESLTEDANRLISQYAAYYPQAAEAFMYDIQSGQSYTVSCGGMRATTTVRTQK